MKRFVLSLLVLVAVALMVIRSGYRQAIAPPIMRRAYYLPAAWPVGTPPVRLVFLSDLHLTDAAAPVARMDRLVDRINALRPDCVLVGGDLVGDALGARPLPIGGVIAALGRLRPLIATILVRGNHDYWRHSDDVPERLRKAAVTLLDNAATRCGALTVGGTEGLWDGTVRLRKTQAAMRALGGVPVFMSHSPDIFPSTKRIGLALAGHTHCGQIALPLIGPVATGSRFGRRYYCGITRERGRFLITTAGIGTTGVPMRWNAPPDFWLITVGPRRRA